MLDEVREETLIAFGICAAIYNEDAEFRVDSEWVVGYSCGGNTSVLAIHNEKTQEFRGE